MPVLSRFTYTAYVLADSLFFSSTPGASSSRGRLQVGGVCKSGASARASSRRERLQVGNAFKSGASLRRHEQFNAACLQCCIFHSNGKKKKHFLTSSWVTFFNIFFITSTRFKRIYLFRQIPTLDGADLSVGWFAWVAKATARPTRPPGSPCLTQIFFTGGSPGASQLPARCGAAAKRLHAPNAATRQTRPRSSSFVSCPTLVSVS